VAVACGIYLAATLGAGGETLLSGAQDAELLALVALTSPAALWGLVGSIWRLRDRRAFLTADAEGVTLHPSFWPKTLPWSAIRSLSIRPDPFDDSLFMRAGALRLLLHEPRWTLARPLGWRAIHLRLRRLDLSRKDAADLLRQLTRLRANSSPARGEGLRSRDPGAAG
jgi:hypothetical protein